MKLALLKGNRFNPWHLQPFTLLGEDAEVVAFRAESEIQWYFHERGEGSLDFAVEPIHFDTEIGNPLLRLARKAWGRYRRREPRILPFAHRLEGFDVIQSWELFTDWTAEALDAKERFGISVSLMVWDNIPFNMERNPERRMRKKRAAAYADAFIVHTERSRRTLDMEGVPTERVVKIDPGVSTSTFAPGPRNRQAFGLPEEEFVILFVGWFLPRKGVDFLILALRELLADPSLKGTAIRLFMVGSGPGKERVEELIARLGVGESCTFAGHLTYEQMPDAYRAADVFVLPSIPTPEWQEQFGMALIEAMACGTPAIASMSGAIPEVVGDAAILCQPNDFVALYESLKLLIKDPVHRKELGQAARARAVEHFDLERYASALRDFYDGLVSG